MKKIVKEEVFSIKTLPVSLRKTWGKGEDPRSCINSRQIEGEHKIERLVPWLVFGCLKGEYLVVTMKLKQTRAEFLTFEA